MVSLPCSIITNVLSVPYVSANLPSDIINDIFARLPVKSLVRFRCVSKSMFALLQSKKFIKKHLDRAMQIDPNLILRTDFKLFAVDDEQWSKARKLKVPFGLCLEKVEVSGSCHGLLCISDQRCNEDIYLFNPSTGVYRKLPPPEFDVPTIETTCFTSLGFGFHGGENDYKVLRSIFLYDKPFEDIDSYQCEARIYSLTTDKWKKIGDVPFHISTRAAVCIADRYFIWKASRGFGRRMSILVVAFDMDKEEFNEVGKPEVSDPTSCQIEVGVMNEQFSIFHMWRGERVEIWAMKEFGVKESWKKMIVIGPQMMMDPNYMFLKPLYMKKNGEILMEKGEGKLVVYQPQQQIVNDFTAIRRAPRWFFLYTYVGSLVSPFTDGPETA
ncbi:F-box protein CPR1-like [Mangifera indica]|uniref:F-box protein CPR1-like n=1 Tax=Mangifera indica TaxID=29780 RepID=UPI001CFBE06A|nr:F-box protein CPR1-like [Mangifera indica]